MTKIAAVLAALATLAFPASAFGELPAGSKAPMFSTQGALAGKGYAFNLQAALRKGPVVLYFYPKAFTHGCTLETKAFADAHDEFAAAGATVIGMSADDLDLLKRFSTEACRDKFAVATASPAIIDAYDVALELEGKASGMADRVSYVIGQDGRIAFVHSDMDYRDHVRLTLAAVKRLAAK
ncbi:peroxiredoxin [Novosphingobium marinum]|uniref:thioredoxin-dependent peroxiredoxin n=1 Tax=Novosphingobium marinum TaxID=1514948 RepID=A0A7Y9XTQ4_9SPHN|nr:peroxiredoxin [Novosphingobium marinum]NYH94345.1 peroxiredoxin [Novosphingobium marinum]GGC21623.1 peroxiredoxin [Novosphingobium marinum]